MTNVGEVPAPRTPRPAPSPWVRVVLPAPRSPVSSTRSPARSTVSTRSPSARVSEASGSVTVTGGPAAPAPRGRSVTGDPGDGAQVFAQRREGGAARAEADRRGRVVGHDQGPAGKGVHGLPQGADARRRAEEPLGRRAAEGDHDPRRREGDLSLQPGPAAPDLGAAWLAVG